MLEGPPKRGDRSAPRGRVSDEQRALLELILRHGESYEDLSDLLGRRRTEVRARAHEALTRVAGAAPAHEAGVCDYLLGQADSSERAAAIRHLHANPDDLARTEAVTLKLRLMVPGASLPELPRLEGAFDGGLRALLRNAGNAVPRFAKESSWQLRLGAAIAGVLLLAALLSEMVLPNLLERRLRGQLEQIGAVERVHVGAFPGVKALWGGMDRLELELGELDARKLGARRSASGDGGAMLERLSGTDVVDVSIDALSAGPARLEDVDVVKTGDRIDARFTLDPDALEKALPLAPGLEAEVTTEGGSLQMLLTGGPFGKQAQTMAVAAEDGQLVGLLELDRDAAKKLGVPRGMDPPPQPLFQNEQVDIESLRAKPSGDRLTVTARAELTGGGEGEPGSSSASPRAPSPTTPPAPESAPPGGSSRAAPGGIPPELVECLAEEGVKLPKGGGLPPGVSPEEIQLAVQACAQHLPQGAGP